MIQEKLWGEKVFPETKLEQFLWIWLKSKKMHKPNDLLGFPGVMLTAGGSECAKHIRVARKGLNYDLAELHSGVGIKGDSEKY